jgi:signal transduction histidine kinase
VRAHPRRKSLPEECRRRVVGLDHLPLRPATVRLLVDAMPDEPSDDESEPVESSKARAACGLDPGWVLTRSMEIGRSGPLALIAQRTWWPRALSSGPAAELMDRLWRHSVAVGIAARGLAREAGDPAPDAVAAAGQLSSLGCWAVAAVEPEWLLAWWRLEDPRRRRQMENDDLGTDLGDLGRRLAERWGCDPLIADAAWLHADHGGALNSAASSPDRLAIVQEAYRWAEQTPWSLGRTDHELTPSEPRLRILMAEVQARCLGAFVDADATPQEERMTRQNARLRRQLAALRVSQGRSDRFLQLLAESSPSESPEEWADRAAMTWCAEPEVSAARVVWLDAEAAGLVSSPPPSTEGPAPTPSRHAESGSTPPGAMGRPPTVVLPLYSEGRAHASIELWCASEPSIELDRLAPPTVRRAWESWAALLANRGRLERRLRAVVGSLRHRLETEEQRLRQGKLEALGEFAAGAGHELNNPLAVVVGRAQLLLARSGEPDVARSLRIILNQAQRAHRILRDLMFIARPPAPRNRSCRPAEVLAPLLREFERDCSARGVRLVADLDPSSPSTWTDPDALRHLAEILLRNALQATPSGGRIQIRSTSKDHEVIWSFSDSGKGIGAGEASHIFDPFYCGRQAGRGLGLGLPRAAKIVDLAGGRLRWTSNPGHETTFQVHLPLSSPSLPEQPDADPLMIPAAVSGANRLLKS